MTDRVDSWRPGAAPILTVGLPVYNGERYLAEALDSLLTQTFTDFELVISDNASTDDTARICDTYAARDRRVRYVRQPVNIGAAPNHNLLVRLARGRYFKWASHDDLYAPELLEVCVRALEANPDVVLAHAGDAFIDAQGELLQELPYALDTADPRPWVRLRSLLRVPGGNDYYGVMRTDLLRRLRGQGAHYHADRVFVAQVALHGPFHQSPGTLYFRRDHPDRASRAGSRRDCAAAYDPRRANAWRYPMPLMHAEYVASYFAAIRRAPLTVVERARCTAEVMAWLSSRLTRSTDNRSLERDLDLAS